MIILKLTITLLVIIFCHAMMLWIEAEPYAIGVYFNKFIYSTLFFFRFIVKKFVQSLKVIAPGQPSALARRP